MRDANRLYNFYNKNRENHMKLPDWRFGQFILNFISWYYNKYKMDIFYIEDDDMLKYIKEFVDEVRGSL